MKSALSIIAAILSASLSAAAAQPDRITTRIDSSDVVELAGNIHGKARAEYDAGPVDPAMKLGYITMQIKPSPAQQADLTRLLAQQQNPLSANYHKWLTPEQYADRFGLSRNDVANVEKWLQSEGFSIVQAARGRDWIAFSGTAAMVEKTFRTEMHVFVVDGETHYANATALSVPQALDGAVVGFRGLHDFSLQRMGIRPVVPDIFPDIMRPFYTQGGLNFLAPGDIATIYDITPLYNASINGTGQKMVVVGQTDIVLTDIENFRSGFSLSVNDPTVVNLTGHRVSQEDVPEADLDLEWSGAVARSATIYYVNSPISSGGVFNSAVYAIDNDLAPVITMSYGGCESENAGFIPTNEPTMQQANVEGITFMASSGDSGAAGCDSDQEATATMGLAVNYPASSPEVTGVGGNEFNESNGNYWGGSGSNGGTAISYIPEEAWNDTTQNGTLSASSGGASSCDSTGCASGFPKPSWQVGTGVPGDKVRDVPDVALAASANHDGFIVCTGGSCAHGINLVNVYGGTSVSTPVFAGVVVLLNQFLGGTGQGNINPTLYKLAQNTSNGVYHDITTGDNIVPCAPGSPDCPSKAPFQIGYNAGVGYDQVTGLGSVDVHALVTNFSGSATTTTLASSLNPAPFGTTVTFTATVKTSGTSEPTGTVTFDDGTAQLGTGTLNASGVATFQTSTLAIGGHSITAAYGGDKKNIQSTSAVLTETITEVGGLATTTAVVANQGPITYGMSASFTATVITTSGTGPGGTVTFQDGTAPLGFATVNATNSTTGTATFATTALTGGTHSITGLYSGDSNNNGSSTSPAIQQIITKATTTIAAPTLSPAAVNFGSAGPVVMLAAVSPSSGPTGSINYSVDGKAAGSANVGSGFSYNPSALAAGAHSVTAAYQGDTNYNGSGPSLAQTLNIVDFKIAANPTTITVSAPGSPGTTTLTITPEGGFSQNLTYSCGTLPSEATCSFAAASSTTETLTIMTTASSGKLERKLGGNSGVFYALLLPGFFGIVLLSGGRKLKFGGAKLLGLVLVLAMATLWMPACGGGSSTPATPTNPGTPTGNSTVIITAATSGSSPISHTVQVTLSIE